MEKFVLPQYQYTKSTSEAAKDFGKATGLSPMKTDYFLNTFFGSVMPVMANITNNLIAESKGVARPTEKGPNKAIVSLLGGASFLGKESTGLQSDFYEVDKQISQTLGTIKKLALTDKPEARKLLEESKQHLSNVHAMEKALATISLQERIIMDRKDLSADQKRAELDKLDDMRRRTNAQIMKIRRKAYGD